MKILTVGKKGYEQLRRLHSKQIVDRIELRGVRTIGYGNAARLFPRLARAIERANVSGP